MSSVSVVVLVLSSINIASGIYISLMLTTLVNDFNKAKWPAIVTHATWEATSRLLPYHPTMHPLPPTISL